MKNKLFLVAFLFVMPVTNSSNASNVDSNIGNMDTVRVIYNVAGALGLLGLFEMGMNEYDGQLQDERVLDQKSQQYRFTGKKVSTQYFPLSIARTLMVSMLAIVCWKVGDNYLQK